MAIIRRPIGGRHLLSSTADAKNTNMGEGPFKVFVGNVPYGFDRDEFRKVFEAVSLTKGDG